jgi:hypothetical protein
MAIMRPEKLPIHILNDPLLKGEIKTFEALKKLSDEYFVFYQCYASPNGRSRAYVRKMDFVVLNKTSGLLAIEVKGGRIRLNEEGTFEQYYDNNWNPMDPFDQVGKAVIDFVHNCKADGANYWIPDDVCVIFPSTKRNEITPMPHVLPNGILCADDLEILPVQIKTLFSKSRKKYAFTDANFLDIRRRIEQRISATGRRKRSAHSQLPIAKELPVAKENWQEIEKNKKAARQNKINYSPQSFSIQATRESKEKRQGKSFAIIVAIFTFFISTTIFLMLINFIRARW